MRAKKKRREHLKPYRLLYVILAVMCNALILRVFRRMRVFLLCAFERQKNALVSAEKSSSKKKTKNFSLLFFPPFPNALSSKKLVHISIEMKKEEMKNKRGNNEQQQQQQQRGRRKSRGSFTALLTRESFRRAGAQRPRRPMYAMRFLDIIVVQMRLG